MWLSDPSARVAREAVGLAFFSRRSRKGSRGVLKQPRRRLDNIVPPLISSVATTTSGENRGKTATLSMRVRTHSSCEFPSISDDLLGLIVEYRVCSTINAYSRY